MKLFIIIILFSVLSFCKDGITNHDIVSEEFYHRMPGNLMVHESCIHSWDDTNLLIQSTPKGDIIIDKNRNEVISILEPCPFDVLNSNLSEKEEEEEEEPSFEYYSGWIEYTGWTLNESATDKFTAMSSQWTVPSYPKKHSIFTSVYFFNGLEQRLHDTPGIIQPVLALGTTGCEVLRYDHWYIASFYVSASGRAHCGKVVFVDENDVILGNMTLNETSNEWTIITEVMENDGNKKKKTVSQLSVSVDFDFQFSTNTMEGIRIYKCEDFPESNEMIFSENLIYVNGVKYQNEEIPWDMYVTHTECGQELSVDSSTADVKMVWKS